MSRVKGELKLISKHASMVTTQVEQVLKAQNDLLNELNNKKNDRTLHASSEPVIDTPENPNNISISDAETQSGDEHEPSDNVNDNVHVDAQPSNDNDAEAEPVVDLDNPQSKNQRYYKRDFVARKHGKEREPWVQKPMPLPPKPSKSKDDEDF